MKFHFILGTFLISLYGQSQSLSDSVKVFHDNEGYLRCIANDEFSATFKKSDLETISTGDKRVVFNAKSKTFRIKDNNNLSGSDFDITLVLGSKTTKVSYSGATYNLDSIDDNMRITEPNAIRNKIVGSLVFISQFENGVLREITFGIRTGMVFQIKVFKSFKNPGEYEYYEIRCKEKNSNTGLLLQYSSNYGTPFTLAIISETSHSAINLNSDGKWKKFKWLSVSHFEDNKPLINFYKIYYTYSFELTPKRIIA